MRSMSAFLYTVAGVVIGGLISLAVSAYYSRRASEELRAEAERLRQESEWLHDITLRMLQTISGGGQVEVNRDEQGRATGVQHGITIGDSLGLQDDAQARTSPADDAGDDESGREADTS